MTHTNITRADLEKDVDLLWRTNTPSRNKQLLQDNATFIDKFLVQYNAQEDISYGPEFFASDVFPLISMIGSSNYQDLHARLSKAHDELVSHPLKSRSEKIEKLNKKTADITLNNLSRHQFREQGTYKSPDQMSAAVDAIAKTYAEQGQVVELRKGTHSLDVILTSKKMQNLKDTNPHELMTQAFDGENVSTSYSLIYDKGQLCIVTTSSVHPNEFQKVVSSVDRELKQLPKENIAHIFEDGFLEYLTNKLDKEYVLSPANKASHNKVYLAEGKNGENYFVKVSTNQKKSNMEAAAGYTFSRDEKSKPYFVEVINPEPTKLENGMYVTIQKIVPDKIISPHAYLKGLAQLHNTETTQLNGLVNMEDYEYEATYFAKLEDGLRKQIGLQATNEIKSLYKDSTDEFRSKRNTYGLTHGDAKIEHFKRRQIIDLEGIQIKRNPALDLSLLLCQQGISPRDLNAPLHIYNFYANNPIKAEEVLAASTVAVGQELAIGKDPELKGMMGAFLTDVSQNFFELQKSYRR